MDKDCFAIDLLLLPLSQSVFCTLPELAIFLSKLPKFISGWEIDEIKLDPVLKMTAKILYHNPSFQSVSSDSPFFYY